MQRLAATATAFPMTTYEQSNFEQIATAIGIARVAQHKNLFEAAALWYLTSPHAPVIIKLRRSAIQSQAASLSWWTSLPVPVHVMVH